MSNQLLVRIRGDLFESFQNGGDVIIFLEEAYKKLPRENKAKHSYLQIALDFDTNRIRPYKDGQFAIQKVRK